jgi:hypothetical protein
MSYHQQLQAYIEEYRRNVHDGPLQVADVAAWLIRDGRWAPSPQAAIGLLARDLSEALRTQYTTDAAGRRVRRKHAVRLHDTRPDGSKQQLVLWVDIALASPQFMQQSIQQRREAIADDCWQLKQDLDSFNQYHNPAEPLQVMLDFSEDVEEREAARSRAPLAAAVRG